MKEREKNPNMTIMPLKKLHAKFKIIYYDVFHFYSLGPVVLPM